MPQEENLDLHVAVGRIAPRDRVVGERRCLTGSGVGFRVVCVVHSFVSLIGFVSDANSGSVLFVDDVLHPVNDLAVQRFLIAMWVIAVAGVAPCQCFSPGGNQTTSPGRISSMGPPSGCAHPTPDVTINV